jgi:hypothetical protein
MSEVDTKRFEGENTEIIDTQLSALQNGLIVSVLVLSIIYPIVYNLEMPAHPSPLQYIEYISMNLAVFGCIVSLYISSLMHLQLAFFLPTSSLKNWYIVKVQHLRPLIETLKKLIAGLHIIRIFYSTTTII